MSATTQRLRGESAGTLGARARALVVAAGMVSSCQPPLEEVWQLRDFRVLGVRVIAADGGAEPGRGEPFTLEVATADVRERPVANVWFVLAIPAVALTGGGGGGAPDGGGAAGITPALIRALVTTCITDRQDFGLFQCGPGSSAMFRVPSDGGAPDAQGRESLTVIGYACAGGSIALDRSSAEGALGPLGSFRCAGDGARGWQYQKTVLLRPAAVPAAYEPNRNPRVTEVRFGMAGATTPIALDVPATVPRCVDTATRNNTCPRLRFEVGFAPDARQAYTALDPLTAMLAPRVERLTVGYAVDRGTLGGGFRTDSSIDPMSVMDNEYRAPAEPGPVRVVVYASDGRGGFELAERRLIVE